MKRFNRILLLVSFIAVGLCVVASAQSQSSAHSSKLNGQQAALFSEISEELICQCGCNLVLGQCGHVNCPSAIPMREKIEEMILAQKNKTEIMAYFMKDYNFRGKGPFGKSILSQPATEGFDLMAWIMPFLLFVVFTAVVFIVVKRSTSKSKTATEAAPSSAPASDLDKRIEDELKKME